MSESPRLYRKPTHLLQPKELSLAKMYSVTFSFFRLQSTTFRTLKSLKENFSWKESSYFLYHLSHKKRTCPHGKIQIQGNKEAIQNLQKKAKKPYQLFCKKLFEGTVYPRKISVALNRNYFCWYFLCFPLQAPFNRVKGASCTSSYIRQGRQYFFDSCLSYHCIPYASETGRLNKNFPFLQETDIRWHPKQSKISLKGPLLA